VVKVKLLASLKEAAGTGAVEVEASSWKEALRLLREKVPSLAEAIGPDGTPRPGYVVFVDGVDYRLVEPDREAREIVILPVNHGGVEDVEEVSWAEIDSMIEELARKIVDDGFKPEVIIGILRGGVVPARVLADKLGVDDMASMEIKLYKGVGIRGERPYLRQPPTLPLEDKAVLVVDDISDTGLTLQFAVEVVRLYLPREVRTATLYIKPWTDFIPDFYARSTEKWVVFPWERGEFRRALEE